MKIEELVELGYSRPTAAKIEELWNKFIDDAYEVKEFKNRKYLVISTALYWDIYNYQKTHNVNGMSQFLARYKNKFTSVMREGNYSAHFYIIAETDWEKISGKQEETSQVSLEEAIDGMDKDVIDGDTVEVNEIDEALAAAIEDWKINNGESEVSHAHDKCCDAYIYCIKIDNRLAYIGKTHRMIKDRLSEHIMCVLDPTIKNSQQRYLYEAMRNAESGWKFEILYHRENAITNYELEQIEKAFIENLRPQYNYEGIVVPYRFTK